jgi:hypothetical protein
MSKDGRIYQYGKTMTFFEAKVLAFKMYCGHIMIKSKQRRHHHPDQTSPN